MPIIKHIDPTDTSLASTPTNREDNTTTQTGMQLAKIIKVLHILMLFLFTELMNNSTPGHGIDITIILISSVFIGLLFILIAAFTVVFILIKYKMKTKGKFTAFILFYIKFYECISCR